MDKKIKVYIDALDTDSINAVRKDKLQELSSIISSEKSVNINFICTHNSRRSHLGQIWAQTIAEYYDLNISTYSGGTESTALFPEIIKVLLDTGFLVTKISTGKNPVYAIKFGDNGKPIIGFSKKYDSSFNPDSEFIAVMTCSSATNECPVVKGARFRFTLTYDDPKISDNTTHQYAVYTERSKQIATEMKYLMKLVKEGQKDLKN